MLRHPSGQVSGHPDPSKETLRCSSEDKSTCGSFLEQGSWSALRVYKEYKTLMGSAWINLIVRGHGMVLIESQGFRMF